MARAPWSLMDFTVRRKRELTFVVLPLKRGAWLYVCPVVWHGIFEFLVLWLKIKWERPYFTAADLISVGRSVFSQSGSVASLSLRRT